MKKISQIAIDNGKQQQGTRELRHNYSFKENKKETLIAQSEFGKVIKASRKNDPTSFVAIKIINKQKLKRDELATINREISVLNNLDNPYIIKYFETYDAKKHLYLVMEYIDGDTLDSFIEVNTKERKYGERTVANILRKLLKAVNHCHGVNVVHRDINPSNIMLRKNNDVCLIDFGLSTNQSDKSNVKQFVGDPNYTAPEVFEGKASTMSDMWSLGVVLYQMISGHQPFEQKTKALIIKDIMAGDWHWRSPEFDNVS